MRSDKEFAAEALRRVAVIKARRKRIREQLVAGAVLAGCLSLAVCAAILAGLNPGTGPPMEAAAGNVPLMFPYIGGYVLCGVICFSLGVALTLLCVRWKGRKNDVA